LARELIGRVRIQLEETVLRGSAPLEARTRRQVIEIMQNCHRELFREYSASRDRQTPATDAQSGSSPNERAPIDTPPMDSLAGFDDTLYQPLSLADDNLLLPDENLFSELYRPMGCSSASDSAYGTQDPLNPDLLGQNSFVDIQQPGKTTDAPQIPGLDASANAAQQGHGAPSIFTWSSLGKYDSV
jgi:hypothetical protein